MELKEQIKLICTDIDGTLLDANRDISLATAKAIKSLNGKIPIILASSRMPSAMYYLQEKLGITGSPLIAYNGGLILDKTRKPLFSATPPMNLLSEIIKHQRDKNYNISIFSNDVWHTETKDEWTLREIKNTRVEPELIPLNDLLDSFRESNQEPHKIMCMGDPEELDDLLKHVAGSDLKSEANFYRSKDTYIEISAKRINKSRALQILLDKIYDLEMKEVMAFGDNHNDIELLKNAGFGITVANATENAKIVADQISDFTNKEDAVAKAIERFFL